LLNVLDDIRNLGTDALLFASANIPDDWDKLVRWRSEPGVKSIAQRIDVAHQPDYTGRLMVLAYKAHQAQVALDRDLVKKLYSSIINAEKAQKERSKRQNHKVIAKLNPLELNEAELKAELKAELNRRKSIRQKVFPHLVYARSNASN